MDTALRPVVPPLPSVVRLSGGQVDAAQDFVNRLRAAAPRFAEAADADHAVVREVVPPARHRRSRCRVVLRAADGSERDLTFLGPVSRPAVLPDRTFEAQIQQWLVATHDGAIAALVSDDEAPDGHAVDLVAWTAPTTGTARPTTAMPTLRAAGAATEAMAAMAAVPVAG